MGRLIIIVVSVVLFAGVSFSHAACLNEGVESFKVVLDAIYEEMGSPEMTPAIADKMDRKIFARPFDKEPAFSPNVNVSWSSCKDFIGAIISCAENGSPVQERVIWRPYEDLETIDINAVLEC